MSRVFELRNDLVRARINGLNSQLFSLEYDGAEFMWAGGGPDELKTPAERKGWQNSEIVMFPIVGKPSLGSITVGGTKFPMTQHGIARYLKSDAVVRCEDEIAFEQTYVAGSVIEGPRGPSSFPSGYRLTKRFTLDGRTLAVLLIVENTSDRSFPYAIGWHPAFRLLGEDSLVEARSRSYSIGEIRNESAGGGALVLEGQGSVEYVSGATTVMTRRSSSVGLRSDFGHVQLWSPAGDGYLCIEPISALSLSEVDKDRELREKEGYVELAPGKSRRYNATITFGAEWQI